MADIPSIEEAAQGKPHSYPWQKGSQKASQWLGMVVIHPQMLKAHGIVGLSW